MVRNSRSGSAIDPGRLEQALRRAGVEADILDIPDEPAFDRWIDGIAARYEVIAAAGGDGTVSSVAAGVARASRTLAVIPSGTLNHFARDLGIPTELDEAVALLRTGGPRPVDVGFVNDQFFLNNVSLGSYPRMVYEREALEARGRSHRLASIVAVGKTWWRLRSLSASITVGGRELVRRSPFIVVGNGHYVLSGFALGRRDNISDRQLSLYVAPRLGRLGAMSIPLRALVGSLERYEQFESLSGPSFTIALKRRRVFAGIDGEVRELESPLNFVVKPGALKVLAPTP